MKLNFQPFRTKIHYGFIQNQLIQNQLDIFGWTCQKAWKNPINLCKFQNFKNYYFATCLKQQWPFFESQGFWYLKFSNLWWLFCGGIQMIVMDNNRIHMFYKYGQQQNLHDARLILKWFNIFILK
jgi:hypothetical protein